MEVASSGSGTATALTSLDVMVAGVAPAPAGYVFRPEGGGPGGRILALVRPGGDKVAMPVLCYVARHPTAGPIAIDTGLHADAIRNLRDDYGLAMGVLFKSLRPSGETYDEQLRATGVDPAEIRLTVMTHLHVDHTSGMRLLPETEFAIAGREWRAATGRAPALGGYVAKHLPPAGRVRQVDLEADGEPYGPFEQSLDLLGDGSIRLLSTPGHTPGHMSVLLRLHGGGEVLVVGDAAYTLRSIREQVLPFRTVDDNLSRRSLRALKDFVDENPDVTVVPTHDPDAWRALA